MSDRLNLKTMMTKHFKFEFDFRDKNMKAINFPFPRQYFSVENKYLQALRATIISHPNIDMFVLPSASQSPLFSECCSLINEQKVSKYTK